MTGWIAQAALGGIFALGGWLAWDLARANLRHGHHEAPRLPPVIVGDGDPRYGSMSLTDELVVHHERPDFIDTFTAGLADRYWPAPSEAEVAAARARHGYIPELDPGPGSPRWAQRDRPGPDKTPDARSNGAVAGSIPAEALAGREFDPSGHQGGLGPRAGAVLAAYEQRLGARREACT